MLTKQTKFIIAIVIQLIIIFSIIIFKTAVLTGGTEVLLRIEPVDPRDPLRGDHLNFSYEISSPNSSLFNYSPIKEGDTVYVPLEQQGKYWVAVSSVQKTKPIGKGKIFLRGKILSAYDNRIQIIYGIEDYFIPEGTGQDFSFWRQEASARVSIDKDGNAVLKQIYVNDKPFTKEETPITNGNENKEVVNLENCTVTGCPGWVGDTDYFAIIGDVKKNGAYSIRGGSFNALTSEKALTKNFSDPGGNLTLESYLRMGEGLQWQWGIEYLDSSDNVVAGIEKLEAGTGGGWFAYWDKSGQKMTGKGADDPSPFTYNQFNRLKIVLNRDTEKADYTIYNTDDKTVKWSVIGVPISTGKIAKIKIFGYRNSSAHSGNRYFYVDDIRINSGQTILFDGFEDKNQSLIHKEFSYPYPLSWQENGVNFDLTGVEFGNMTAPQGTLDRNLPYEGFYEKGEKIYALKLILKVKMPSNQNRNQCVGINFRLLLDEEGNKAPSNSKQFFFPAGGCIAEPDATYFNNPIVFVVPETQKDFTITTGGQSDVFFEVKVLDNGDIKVEKVPMQSQGE